MNNVSGYSPCPIYGQILSVKSQMLFYTVGGSFLLCAPGSTNLQIQPAVGNCIYIMLRPTTTIPLQECYIHRSALEASMPGLG